MSRIINIKGKVVIQNIEIAKEAIKECDFDIQIKDNKFIYNDYDYYDGVNKDKEIETVENLYLLKYNAYIKELEQEERLKVEKEKELLREEKYNQIIQNAQKQGYKVKKEKKEDNTIKLILQKRVY